LKTEALAGGKIYLSSIPPTLPKKKQSWSSFLDINILRGIVAVNNIDGFVRFIDNERKRNCCRVLLRSIRGTIKKSKGKKTAELRMKKVTSRPENSVDPGTVWISILSTGKENNKHIIE